MSRKSLSKYFSNEIIGLICCKITPDNLNITIKNRKNVFNEIIEYANKDKCLSCTYIYCLKCNTYKCEHGFSYSSFAHHYTT